MSRIPFCRDRLDWTNILRGPPSNPTAKQSPRHHHPQVTRKAQNQFLTPTIPCTTTTERGLRDFLPTPSHWHRGFQEFFYPSINTCLPRTFLVSNKEHRFLQIINVATLTFFFHCFLPIAIQYLPVNFQSSSYILSYQFTNLTPAHTRMHAPTRTLTALVPLARWLMMSLYQRAQRVARSYSKVFVAKLWKKNLFNI